jgi:lipopolysaccharide/colanic/teichoic acid biosynthesis glycosyltransferase
MQDPLGLSLRLLYEGDLLRIAAGVVVVQIALYVERMYRRLFALRTILRQLFLSLGVAFLLQALLAFLRSPIEMPRWTMIYGSGLILIAFPLWRWAAALVLGTGIPARKILFLGASPAAEQVVYSLKQQPELGLTAVGYLRTHAEAFGLARLGELDSLDAVIEEFVPQRIAIARGASALPIRRLIELQRAGMRLEKLADLHEGVCGRISLLELPPERLVFSAQLDPRPGYLIARDIYSILTAALLLIPAAPLIAVTALALKIRSSHPAIQRDLRAGLRGKPIALYRFNAAVPWKWLRSLPLLINVLRGDVVWVGPVPERPEFVTVLRDRIPFYNHRLSVKPGLTGWARIHEDAGVPDSLTALEYDLYYIKHLSPAIDAYIAMLSLRPRG